MRKSSEIQAVLREILNHMPAIEKSGDMDYLLMFGAFCDGLAFALGTNVDMDYLEEARKLEEVAKQDKQPNWEIV